MKTTRADAMNLLFGWMSDSRAVHALYSTAGVEVSVVGFIDSFADNTLKISASRVRKIPFGNNYRIFFDMSEAEFEFGDAREAEKEFREVIGRSYESFMWIKSRAGRLMLCLISRTDEVI